MMKPSIFNIYEETYSYIANTLTGSCIQATKEEIRSVRHGKLTGFDKDGITILKENGIIVNSELDELQLLRNAYNFCKYSNKKTVITIAPSLSCNFDCVYCYEKKNNECMSKETQNQVLIFLQSLLNDNQITELNICWYGGEPLLQMEIIKRLSVEIQILCKEKGIIYNASIITNGYLINDEMVERFEQCHIKTAQITIDGAEKTHNARRKLDGGGETYEKVKKGIFLLAENDIKVSVRVNLDKSNVHEYKTVLDTFAVRKNIICYPAIVTVEETQGLEQRSCCYAHKELKEFYDVIGKEINDSKENLCFQPGVKSCAAEHAYSYLIAPDGYLYKCLNDISNHKYAIGHISDEVDGTIATAKYLGRDPFSETECRECPYIPLCYGGCVYEYKKHNTHACREVRFMYKKYCQGLMGGGQDEGNCGKKE